MRHNTGKARGRPRTPDIDRRILEAALQLMARSGYARMTMDEVAACAGVSKPTIYLRYESKARLATVALAYYRVQDAPEESGDIRRDLIAALQHFRTQVERPYGMSMIGSVLAEEHETPDLLALFREHVVRPRRAMLRAVLDRGIQLGAIRGDVSTEAVVHMLVGAYYAQYLSGQQFDAEWSKRLVDVVWNGIARQVPQSQGG